MYELIKIEEMSCYERINMPKSIEKICVTAYCGLLEESTEQNNSNLHCITQESMQNNIAI